MNIDARFHAAVQSYWAARDLQRQKQLVHGNIDTGTRGSVTGGTQMGGLEVLVSDLLIEAGLDKLHIRTRTALELPGYYRPEKKWDLLVVADRQLIAAMEFKSQVGPSFGNNFNNRTEEAIGSATDLWIAYREGRLGRGPRPFLGYFFLLEDCPQVRKPVKNSEPYFKVDPEFVNASYARRYELLLRRMVLERLYDAACLTLTTKEDATILSHPSDDLSFKRFASSLQGNAYAFLQSR